MNNGHIGARPSACHPGKCCCIARRRSPTAVDIAPQAADLTRHSQQGYRAVLIGHSQGNRFASTVYDDCLAHARKTGAAARQAKVQLRTVAFARPLSICLLNAALCLALAACGGGGDDGPTNAITADTAATPTTVTPSHPVTARTAVLEQRKTPLSASSDTSVVDGVRPDVTAFIAALTVADTQRAVLYQAARALQTTLTVDLARRAGLQAAVDDLAQAQACTRTHFANGEAIWGALKKRTYDTLLRRLRQALFLAASHLLTERHADVVCTSAPPPDSGDGDSGIPTPPSPPSPPPSAALQLREEIARLEQQGVLPTLDRGTDIRGPDANSNGVRDDIDAYIAALPITDPQKKAAMQTARVQQRSLLMDLDDKAAVKALGDASMAATACIGDAFEPDRRQSYEVARRIEAITANTPERARRYIQYMAALSGTSTTYPEGNTCEE